MIPYDDFAKLDLRVATVTAAQRVEGSEKLLKLQVDVGEFDAAGLPAARQVIAGIGKAYEPAALVGTQIVIVANLEPRKLMGLESQGMLLAAHSTDGAPILLRPDSSAPPGSKVS